MNYIEEMKLALEALEEAEAGHAAQILRQAIKQAEQAQPVAWRDHVEQRLLTWRQSFVSKSGDQLALDDFMDKSSLDDLIDFVCDEYIPPRQPLMDLDQISEVLRRKGLTLVKTAKGYDVMNLGQITAHGIKEKKMIEAIEQAEQSAPLGIGSGLVAIKTLLSRDPCAHAKVAIEMIDAMLAEQQDVPETGNTDDLTAAYMSGVYDGRKGREAIDVIKLANQAGLCIDANNSGIDDLHAFTALHRAAVIKKAQVTPEELEGLKAAHGIKEQP